MSVNKRIAAFVLGLALSASCMAATTFPVFGPATGVLKGSASSPLTTAAASGDIIALWAGSCSVSTILRGDGTCASPVSSFGAALTRTNDTNVTLTLGGTPTTALLAPTSMTLGWTGQLAAARGGTGVSTLGTLSRVNDTNVTLTLGGTPTGALITDTSMTLGWSGQLAAARGGTGVSSLGNLTKVDDTNVTLTLGGTPTGAVVTSTSMTLGWSGTLAASRGGLGMSAVTDDTVAVANGTTWQSKALTDCDAATSAVTYDTATNAWGCNTISGATFANPTASVGLTAVNGAATTAMRSDGAPALSQSIAPTWTSEHRFSGTLTGGSFTALDGLSLSKSGGVDPVIWFRNGSAGTDAKNWAQIANATNFVFVLYDDTGANQRNIIQANRTAGALTSLAFGDATNNNSAAFLGTGTVNVGGAVTVGSPTGGSQGTGTVNATGLFINGVPVTGGATETGSFTGTMTGLTAGLTCTVKYRKTGQIVYIYTTNNDCLGTSNAATMTMTGLPSGIRPNRGVTCLSAAQQDNSASVMGNVDIGGGLAAGTLQFNIGTVSGARLIYNPSGWTSSGGKGPTANWSCQYDLDS